MTKKKKTLNMRALRDSVIPDGEVYRWRIEDPSVSEHAGPSGPVQVVRVRLLVQAGPRAGQRASASFLLRGIGARRMVELLDAAIPDREDTDELDLDALEGKVVTGALVKDNDFMSFRAMTRPLAQPADADTVVE